MYSIEMNIDIIGFREEFAARFSELNLAWLIKNMGLLKFHS